MKAKKNKNFIEYDKRIIDAFIKLSKKNNWQEPSITDVVEEAKMTRQTFYLHFKSINDIYNKLEEELINKYVSFYSKRWKNFSQNLLQTHMDLTEVLKQNEELFRCFINSPRYEEIIYKLTCKIIKVIESYTNSKGYYKQMGDDIGWWDWLHVFTTIETEFHVVAGMLKGNIEVDYDFISYWCADLAYKLNYDGWKRVGKKIPKHDFLQEYINKKKLTK